MGPSWILLVDIDTKGDDLNCPRRISSSSVQSGRLLAGFPGEFGRPGRLADRDAILDIYSNTEKNTLRGRVR